MRRVAFPALALALIGGAIAADEVRPFIARAPAGVRVATAGGMLACPFGSTGTGRAYLHLANVGAEPSRARIAVIPRRGKVRTVSATLAAGTTRTVALHGRVKGASSAIVEYGGGELVASHSIWLRSSKAPRGIAAAACARPGAAEVVLPHGRTLRAETRIAILNPGTAPADVTVTLLDDGEVRRPERLSRRVVPPRSKREFLLGDFAFDARELTAIVKANAGRVVAESFVESRSAGIALAAAQVPSPAIVAIAGKSGAGSTLGLVPIGEDDAGIDSRLFGATGQGRAPGVPPALGPGEGANRPIPSRDRGGPAALAFDVTVGAPVVAGTSWVRTNARARARDRAAAEAGPPALRWAGVLAGLDPAGRVRAIIATAGPERATFAVRTMGSRGPSEVTRTVEAGRVLVLEAGRGAGAVGVEVRSDRPVSVLLDAVAASPTGVSAFAVSASALRTPAPVAVKVDQRVGVPALEPPEP